MQGNLCAKILFNKVTNSLDFKRNSFSMAIPALTLLQVSGNAQSSITAWELEFCYRTDNYHLGSRARFFSLKPPQLSLVDSIVLLNTKA